MNQRLVLLLALCSPLAAAAGPDAPAPSGAASAVAESTPDARREQALVAAFKAAFRAGDPAAMAEALASFKALPAISRSSKNAMERQQRDATLVGAALPTDAFASLTWIQGSSRIRGDQLIVFAEQWCPHCRREVPDLPAFSAQNGLELVLVTRMNRGVARETVDAWLIEAGVTGPVGHDAAGALTAAVGGGPVPNALLVRDGIIVWRGHPAHLDQAGSNLTDTLLDKKAVKRATAAAPALAAAVASPWPPLTDAETAGSGADPDHEREAFETWTRMREALDEADVRRVRELVAVIERDFSDTRALQEIADVKDELAILGSTVGEAPLRPLQGTVTWPPTRPTAVVFWEVWCPHCRKSVPELPGLAERFAGRLDVVGITRLTHTSTVEATQAFLDEHGVDLPMAIDEGGIADDFAVTGVPAAALIREGRIVWRGHPAMLSDVIVEKLLTEPVDELIGAVTP